MSLPQWVRKEEAQVLRLRVRAIPKIRVLDILGMCLLPMGLERRKCKF
jgi:hypothetical protein